jgi:cytidyltransferase-like protein
MKKKTKTHKSGTKVVLFQGTFDIINWGHIKAFEMCKGFGTRLIVALNTDKLVKSYKHRDPVLPYYQKKFIIESCRYVDEVVPAPHFSPIELLKKYDVDVYCIGSEWIESKSEEIKWIKAKNGEIRIIPEFKGVIHTSTIKKTLLDEAQNGIMKDVI